MFIVRLKSLKGCGSNKLRQFSTIICFVNIIAGCAFVVLNVVSGAREHLCPDPTTEEVVRQLVDRNEQRARNLKHYSGIRHYTLEYNGFPSFLSASITVLATYDAPGRKEFQIISQNGSALLRNKVLVRLLSSEREASDEINRQHVALTPDNYIFKLAGMESLAGRDSYMLLVEPKVRAKFLYRGKIWVDAEDFAVVKIQAQPAVNPSFWIERSDIKVTYSKVGEFWLPVQNRTISRVILRGTATLTIDYQDYVVVPPQTRRWTSDGWNEGRVTLK